MDMRHIGYVIFSVSGDCFFTLLMMSFEKQKFFNVTLSSLSFIPLWFYYLSFFLFFFLLIVTYWGHRECAKWVKVVKRYKLPVLK